MINSLNDAFDDLGIPKDPSDWWEGSAPKHLFSSKQGPNGPATMTGYLDALSYTDEQIKDLDQFSKNYVEIWSEFRHPSNLIKKTRESAKDFTYNEALNTRRLSAIADNEGKTRVIAIGDYYSQLLLKPIHDRLMRLLRKIPQDMTYNQDCLGYLVKTHYLMGRIPTSTDLKTATDRIPVKLTASILAKVWNNEDLANSWLKLMSSWEFKNCGRDPNQRYLKYVVGQPMGLYSSWPALAITNHVLIRLAAKRIGINRFEEYIVLGDDVVIFSREVAVSYQLILDEIGVKIDPIDSFYDESSSSLEFAKRIFRHGKEISPLPIRLMKRDISLFQLYLLERNMKCRIDVTSREESLKRLASHLLWLLKRLPKWSNDIGHRNVSKNLIDKLIDLGSDSDEYKIWIRLLDDLRFNNQMSSFEWNQRLKLARLGVKTFSFYLIYDIANKWMQVRSYKIYDDYENFLQSFNISSNQVKRITYSKILNKRLRPFVTKGSLREVSDYWLKENTIKGVNNTSVYRYESPIKASGSTKEVISVSESYSSFSEMIDNMNGWISIKVKDMFLDSRDTLNQQNVLQLYEIIKEQNLEDQVLEDLDHWVLTQLNFLDNVSESKILESQESSYT